MKRSRELQTVHLAKGPARKKRKGKAKLPVETTRFLRKTWLDGDIWASNKFLSDMLGEFLGEASGRDVSVPPEDWVEASLECNKWSVGKNQGPMTEQGSFQRALRRCRESEGDFSRTPAKNIIEHWLHKILVMPLPQL